MTSTIALPPGPMPGALTAGVDRMRVALAAQMRAKTNKNLLSGRGTCARPATSPTSSSRPRTAARRATGMLWPALPRSFYGST
jgi:hypothetical protein